MTKYVVSNPDYGCKNLYVDNVEAAHSVKEYADDFHPAFGWRVGGFESLDEAHEYARVQGWVYAFGG